MTVVAARPDDGARIQRRAGIQRTRSAIATVLRRLGRRPVPGRPARAGQHAPDSAVELASTIDAGEQRDRQTVVLREQAFGPDHPDVASALHILGARYHLVHRYDEAATLYERALAIRTARLGHDHPGSIEVLEDLGDLWRDRGDAFRAQAAYELALAAVADPLRRHRKEDDYTARLAPLGIGAGAPWGPKRRPP